MLNFKRVQNWKLPYSNTLGALTYPVYLIHAHFGYMFISHFVMEENQYSIYALTFFIVMFVEFFMNRFIEVGLASFWKNHFILFYPVLFLK
jgi:peptidoglycan/LPS O-acetylase OafA/YrhL